MLKIQDGGCIVCAEDKCCWYPCQDHDLDPGSVFVVRVWDNVAYIGLELRIVYYRLLTRMA